MLVNKASKNTDDSKLQEIFLKPNKKDETNSSWAKCRNKANWCKRESMERAHEGVW